MGPYEMEGCRIALPFGVDGTNCMPVCLDS